MNYSQDNGRPLDRSQYLAAFNEGLRVYMQRVFTLMAMALALSGAVAFVAGTSPELAKALYGTSLRWVVIFAPLVVVLIMSFKAESLSLSGAQGLFWLYSGLMGLSLGSIFIIFQLGSIAHIFFITASVFGSMALYGYTTKKDLTSMGSFLIMGLWGIIIASLVNLFLHSQATQYAISAIAVLVFTGLTAYDTQKIKDIYYGSDSVEVAGKKAIFGALALYLDFINLFIALLQLFGQRRD